MTSTDHSHDSLSTELADFVQENAGNIIHCKRSAGGSSRITWLLETTEGQFVLREDPGDGPVANTPLTLRREAIIYRALAGTSVRIPRLFADCDKALLVEMAEGQPDLEHLNKSARIKVLDDYVDALAELHTTNIGSGCEDLDPPADASQAASHIVKLWEGIFHTRVKRASPLATVATRWLLANAPTNAERLVICHGDVGPGNFMHDGERVTALLDWEFVHVGDPMDDLAWLAFRGHHMVGEIGDFHAQIERWQSRTGFTVDWRRIEYYRIVVMYIWLVSCLAALDNGARNQDRFTYLNLINLINVIMPRAMLSYEDRDAPEVDLELKSQDSELTEHISALLGLIALKWTPTDPGRVQVELMANQILALSQLQDSIAAENRNAISQLVGKPLRTADYNRTFDEWIALTPERDNGTLEVIYANGLRRMQSDIVMKPIADKPFLKL